MRKTLLPIFSLPLTPCPLFPNSHLGTQSGNSISITPHRNRISKLHYQIEFGNENKDNLNFNFIQHPARQETITSISGRKGVIFFKRCFNRDNGSRGSHIDYWGGTRYTNAARGNGAADGNLRLFSRSTRVYFSELS